MENQDLRYMYTTYMDTSTQPKAQVSIPHLQNMQKRLDEVQKQVRSGSPEYHDLYNIRCELQDILEDATQLP